MHQPTHQVVLRLAAVALELAVGLDDHHVDVEGREPGGLNPVALVAEAALEGRGGQPADEGMLTKRAEGRRALVMGHNAVRQLLVLEAFAQVVVLHLVTVDRRGGKGKVNLVVVVIQHCTH